MDAASDEKIMKLLFEVENLQRTLSQERQEYADHLKDLQVSIQNIMLWLLLCMYCSKENISCHDIIQKFVL